MLNPEAHNIQDLPWNALPWNSRQLRCTRWQLRCTCKVNCFIIKTHSQRDLLRWVCRKSKHKMTHGTKYCCFRIPENACDQTSFRREGTRTVRMMGNMPAKVNSFSSVSTHWLGRAMKRRKQLGCERTYEYLPFNHKKELSNTVTRNLHMAGDPISTYIVRNAIKRNSRFEWYSMAGWSTITCGISHRESKHKTGNAFALNLVTSRKLLRENHSRSRPIPNISFCSSILLNWH